MLIELTPVATADLPLAALRDHLRLGTGFADDGVQDPVLEAALRAALAAVEGRTARPLLARVFELKISEHRREVVLPHGPATAVTVEVEDAFGLRADATPGVAVRNGPRPVVSTLPAPPPGGALVVGFAAGFGSWEAVPPDLRQAVLMLAASYYEDRSAASDTAFPAIVAGLIAPWRVLRLRADR